MMKYIAVLLVTTALAVTSGAFAAGTSRAVPCDGPSVHSWYGTVSSYGLRDYTVAFCGAGDLDIAAEVDVKGRKNVALLLIEPDGTVHAFSGRGGATGEIQGPLANGDWRIIVHNLGSSRLKFDAQLAFE